MVSTPLIMEVELPDSGSISPWCIRYSPSGEYLAVHTRAFLSSTSQETYQLFIFDTKNNYSFVAYTRLSNGLEDLDWNSRSDILLGAGSNGELHLFEFDQMNNELALKKSIKLSSSIISSVCYYESVSEKYDTRAGILAGTSDGNAYFIDPLTMSCTHSLLSDIDFPILKVSLGPDGKSIIPYLESDKEKAFVIRISAQDNMYENLATIEDIFSTSNAQSGSSNVAAGCGALITKFSVVVHVKKDGKLSFETINELLSNKSNDKTNDKTKDKDEDKTKNEAGAPKRSNTRKRPADLFNRIKYKEEQGSVNIVSSKKQKEGYSKSQRDYWDSRQNVKDREKAGRDREVVERERGRDRERDRERDSWRYKRVNRK